MFEIVCNIKIYEKINEVFIFKLISLDIEKPERIQNFLSILIVFQNYKFKFFCIISLK